MALNTTLRIKLAAAQTGSNDFGGPSFTPMLEHAINLLDGTAADQADLLFVDQRTVNASSNDDLDLAGVLTSAFGSTITAAEVVAIVIINAPQSGAANTSSLTIGGSSAPFIGFVGGTTPTIGPIGPGGVFVIACPTASGIGAVTATTGDILRVANGSGGTAVYQIGIVARSA